MAQGKRWQHLNWQDPFLLEQQLSDENRRSLAELMAESGIRVRAFDPVAAVPAPYAAGSPDDLVRAVRPRRAELKGVFNPRGGIAITVEAVYP